MTQVVMLAKLLCLRAYIVISIKERVSQILASKIIIPTTCFRAILPVPWEILLKSWWNCQQFGKKDLEYMRPPGKILIAKLSCRSRRMFTARLGVCASAKKMLQFGGSASRLVINTISDRTGTDWIFPLRPIRVKNGASLKTTFNYFRYGGYYLFWRVTRPSWVFCTFHLRPVWSLGVDK